jgi:biopolymer transport protein ExbB/TolQ
VPAFLEHIAKLPEALQKSLIVKRMQLGLQHFQVRHSNPEVANMMMSQSEIDASTINSSFSLLKVFLWAIPILGFVGTVMGISDAVGGFSGSLEAAQEISKLKESLNDVTSGLAVAFDTTLVALVMSLIISFPANAMQKAEEDLLGWVDAYCNENLLKRLDDVGGVPSGTGDAQTAIQAISQSIAKSQQGILAEFRQVQDNMAQVQGDQVTLLQGMAEAVDQQLASMEERAKAHQEQLEANLAKVVNPVGKAMRELSEHGRKIESQSGQVVKQSAEAIQALLTALAEGLGGLNAVLTDLGRKQVVIQQAPRRGWLPFRRKK